MKLFVLCNVCYFIFLLWAQSKKPPNAPEPPVVFMGLILEEPPSQIFCLLYTSFSIMLVYMILTRRFATWWVGMAFYALDASNRFFSFNVLRETLSKVLPVVSDVLPITVPIGIAWCLLWVFLFWKSKLYFTVRT